MQFGKGLSGKCGAFCITENLLKWLDLYHLGSNNEGCGEKKAILNIWGFLTKTFFAFFLFCFV